MARYIVCQTITSRQHNRTFEVGEEIEFAPNPEAADGEQLPEGTVIVDVAGLLAMGAIAPIEDADPSEKEIG